MSMSRICRSVRVTSSTCTADNDGSAVAGGYLGWDDPAFYLTTDEIGTYRIVDRESGQTISEGGIRV